MTLDPKAILRHGIRSVLSNASATLRLSWPWLIIFAVAYGVFAYTIFQSGFGSTPLDPEAGAGAVAFAALILIAVLAVGFSSIAVNWHRYILLDEMPGVSQRLRLDSNVTNYLLRGFLAGLLTVLVMFVPVAILGTIVAAMFPNMAVSTGGAPQLPMGPGYVVMLLMTVVVVALGTAVFFRFALALPAAALGRADIGIFDSWARTRGLFWPLTIVAGGAALLQVIAQVVVDGISYVAMSVNGALGLIVSIPLTLVVLWFFTFFGITLLTTLYGHIVENRRL